MAGTLVLTDAPDTLSDGNNVVFDESGGALVDDFGVALRTEQSPLGRVFTSGLLLTDAADTLSSWGAVFWPTIVGTLAITDEPDLLTARVIGWWPKRAISRPWSESPDPVGGWTPKPSTSPPWSESPDPVGGWTKLNPSSGGWGRAS